MPPRFLVRGGRPLRGTVRPAGNKNAALPILAATVLADGVVELDNIPRIRDVETMLALLQDLGAEAEWTAPNTVQVDTRALRPKPLDPGLCARIRASSDGLSTVPGQIALQRMPWVMKSAATDLVRPITAAFDAP